ncbi:MAG: GNAT family N-acetyltransferase [Bacteroidia bacterium]|nr:GNAT family N-acetyltransferase [Bacteroidia bacterium]
MEFTHPQNAREFLALTREALEKREAENGLILGLALNLSLKNPDHDPTYYLVGAENGVIQCAAMKTEGRNLLLHFEDGRDAELAGAIARHVHANQILVPGIFSPKTGAEAFAQTWQSLTGKTPHLENAMRLFRLDQIETMGTSPGKLRKADLTDLDTLTRWYIDFHHESLPGQQFSEEFLAEDLHHRVTEGIVFLWEDHAPVCMAIALRPTRHGITIGYVYTPPWYRNHGYATSCTAHLSALLLDSGKQFCSLYTDLSNPVSNSIYQKIGYKPLTDLLTFAL